MASNAGYKRRSPPALGSSQEPGDFVVNDFYMPNPQVPNPRKRQRSEQRPLQPLSKRQELRYPATRSEPPAAFWDNLSKVDLTKRALRELDRRNTLSVPSAPCPSYRQPYRPLTRSARAELKRNRQPTQSAFDFLHDCAPRDLKGIKLFTRHGGPDLTGLRGYPELINPLNHTMSSSQSRSRGRKRDLTSTSNTEPTTKTTTSKSTGPYNPNFEQALIDGGIYPYAYEYPDGTIPAEPNNWEEINQRLAERRRSLSPSNFSGEAFKKFKRADAHAFKEKQITTSVIPIIEGNIEDAKCVSGGIPFTNLDQLTDGKLVSGNPDIYYGARPEQLDRRVRYELSGHIIPSTQDDLPLVPNFFVEVKGPNGPVAVAKRQACYYGALGARGIHSLQSYGQDDPFYDKNAYSISVTYHDGTLKMFTSYPTQPAGFKDRPQYFMHQVNSWSMTGNIETFRQGATHYRNGRDWAREQRDAAIERANERVNNHHAGTLAIEAGTTRASSVANEATLNRTSTIEALSEESRTSLTEDSNTTTRLQRSEASSNERMMDHRAPSKRSVEYSSGPSQSRRKRRDAGNSDHCLPEPQLSDHSGLSQQFEDQALEQEPGDQPSPTSLQPIVQETSTTVNKSASKKGKRKQKI